MGVQIHAHRWVGNSETTFEVIIEGVVLEVRVNKDSIADVVGKLRQFADKLQTLAATEETHHD